MKRRLLFVTVFLVAALTAFGATAEVRGVSDDEIRIGQWGPQTGPAALWGAVARGTDLYFTLINEEGGIHGRKIKYYLRDDSYNPAKTKAIAKEFVDRIGVFGVVGGVGTGPGMAVRDFLMENKVIWVAPSTGSTHWTIPLKKYLFAVYPRYTDEAYLLTRYSVKNLGKKIAVFYQNDDYGKEGLRGVQKYMHDHDMGEPITVSVEVTDTDLSSHALKLKESGAEVVIMYLLPKHGAIILGEAAKIGYKPKWVSTNTLSDAPLMVKITKGLWGGTYFSNFGELPDSQAPLMIKYREAQKRLAPKERWGTFYLAGILFAEPMVEGLKRAGRNLTPETMVKAMESIKDFQGIGPPISFSADDHMGCKSVFLARANKDGSVDKLTDWITITE